MTHIPINLTLEIQLKQGLVRQACNSSYLGV